MTAHSLMFGPADIARAVQEGRDAERERILKLLENSIHRDCRNIGNQCAKHWTICSSAKRSIALIEGDPA